MSLTLHQTRLVQHTKQKVSMATRFLKRNAVAVATCQTFRKMTFHHRGSLEGACQASPHNRFYPNVTDCILFS